MPKHGRHRPAFGGSAERVRPQRGPHRRGTMTDLLDPLETSRQIEESYKRYLKTLLAPRDGKLADAFDAEIDATTLLTKGPILELTPPYETASTPRQLIEQGVLHSDFARLDSPTFP